MAVDVAINVSATTVPETPKVTYGDVVPIPSLPVALFQTRLADPAKLPEELNCNCPSEPPGVPDPPPPVPRQTPFTETHPLDSAMPPANVDVDVLLTARFVSVVVPKLEIPADNVLAATLVFVMDPPFMVGLFIDVFVRVSILCDPAICW